MLSQDVLIINGHLIEKYSLLKSRVLGPLPELTQGVQSHLSSLLEQILRGSSALKYDACAQNQAAGELAASCHRIHRIPAICRKRWYKGRNWWSDPAFHTRRGAGRHEFNKLPQMRPSSKDLVT